jgi:tRNA A37 threonylcarbamoyladenosine dehydratase/adenine C2-methylase RlmN of 23S rRNA A2503 and tRNA A37
MTLIMKSAFSLTSHEWSHQLPAGVRPYFLRGLYGDRALWSKHVSPELLLELEHEFHFTLPQISRTQAAQDGTIKFQVRFDDGLEAETVLIPFHKRYSVCLSSQVGCGMNCSFCFTGTQGLKRNLEAGEIVGQYLVALHWLRQKDPLAPLPSIVFMGQGEPLHNVSEVKKAIAVLNDPALVGVGHRQVTLSTVGYLPHLPLLKDFPRINLALSLHSPFEEERAKLIPLEKRFPLTEVLAALDQIPLLKRQFINYEYLLIKNFNMTENHAKELQRLLGAMIFWPLADSSKSSNWRGTMETRQDDFESRFGGIARLYGRVGFERIRRAQVLVIGIGGVGSWAAEALARTGIGGLTLVDLDDVCVTNINRQVHALNGTVGNFKVDVMQERIGLINPSCQVDVKQCFFSPKNLTDIFDKQYDYVIDACDDFTNKAHLIHHCRQQQIPLIVMGGAGGKVDPTQINVTDMSVSSNDRLLARLRKKLRQEFDFPGENAGPFGVLAVWSRERAVYPTPDGCTTFTPPGWAKNMDCAEGFGSASFVTGAFAFAAVSTVLAQVIKENKNA